MSNPLRQWSVAPQWPAWGAVRNLAERWNPLGLPWVGRSRTHSPGIYGQIGPEGVGGDTFSYTQTVEAPTSGF